MTMLVMPSAAADAIIKAYYTVSLNAPAVARTRALAAFTVSGGVAATIVIGLVFGPAERIAGPTRAIAIGAFSVWLLAAGMYVRAVAVPISAVVTAAQEASQFAKDVLLAAVEERRLIDRRQRIANVAAVVAGLITLVAVLSMLRLAVGQDTRPVEIAMGPAAQLPAECGSSKRIVGEATGALTGDSISVTVDAGQCGQARLRLVIPVWAVSYVRSR